MRDPHEILGINKSATEAAIKNAFRQKAKRYHPDLNPGDPMLEQEFKQIVAAYHACLKQLKIREEMAQQGASFSDVLREAGGGGDAPPRPEPPPRRTPDPTDHVDLSGRNPEQRAKKPDANAEAASTSFTMSKESGITELLRDKLMSGIENMMRRSSTRNSARMEQEAQAKQQAMGAGEDHDYTLGLGIAEAQQGGRKKLKLKNGRNVQVTIKPGTREGQVLRLKGLGQAAQRHLHAGDALVRVSIVDDQFGERVHDDFFLKLPVTLKEAIFGGELTIPGLYENLKVQIPPGSNSGSNLRLRGKGYWSKNGKSRGDQYVTLQVRLPKPVDRRLREFVGRWSKEHDYDVRSMFNIDPEEPDQPDKKGTS